MWFNVGGVMFETRARTLARYASYFSEFASYDEETTIFIDRDPTHFRHVLNFLRGSLTYPPSRLEVQELINEARFYALDGLANQLVPRVTRSEHDLSYHLMILSSRVS